MTVMPLSQVVKAPQFGWTTNNPPAFRIELKPSDVQAEQNTPTDSFVKRVAGQLSGLDDDTARFAVIQNTSAVLGDDANVRTFQHHLQNRVYQQLQQDNEWFVSPAKLETKSGLTGKVEGVVSKAGYAVRALRRKLKPFIKEHTPETQTEYGLFNKNREMNGLNSVHVTHFDYDHGLLSIMYGPFKNIKGGGPKISDIRQYVRDKGKKSVRQFMPLLTPVRKSVRNEILDKYTLNIDIDAKNDRPLFLLVNRRDENVGVAHGVSDIKVVNTTQDAERRVFYNEISDDEKSINTWC